MAVDSRIFERLVQTARDYAMVVLDPQGQVLTWNEGARLLSGYAAEDIVGQHFSVFYTEDARRLGGPEHGLKTASAEGRFEDEGWRVRKDGSRFWANVIMTALHNEQGELLGFSNITRERTTRHLTEFIAVLAHELRNPLAPIRNAVHVIERSPGDPYTQQAMRKTIVRQADHLSRIVDDMLDISRVTRGTLSIQKKPVPLIEVINTAVEIVAPDISNAVHKLTVMAPQAELQVTGDKGRLVQLMTHLLINAVRFTPAGGNITISTAEENGQAAISVVDTGRGIAAEDLQIIFGMFVQGKDPLHRVGGGLGVGLAVARRIAELHGGTIQARSAGADQGSEFIFRLPVAQGAPQAVQAPANGDLTLDPLVAKRILVVDDSADVANTMERLLHSLGHITRVAYDGPTAIAIADEFHPEIVLLDIGMPGMSGYEVAQHLRARGSVKIVAVTGWGGDVDRARSANAGIDLHLVKPVGEAELRHVVATNGAMAH